MPFYDRRRELDFLARATPGERAALLVLYGRRRTGKTALLRHFCRERRSIFFVADLSSRADQLAAFSRVAFSALGLAELQPAPFSSWEDALRFVTVRAGEEPLLLVLDEFSYLCQSDPSLPSVLQRLWDAEIKGSRLHLVLCGSYVAFMEKELLGARNPLYGRRSGEWLLEPLDFAGARHFFAALDVDRQLQLYGVVGGVPAYLERMDPARSLEENILEQILRRGAPLYNEPRFLLMQELREPHTYFSICRAIATGRTTPNEIAQGAGLSDRGAVSKYLQTLRELRVVQRRTPVSEPNPERTRRGRYRLADPFLRFWFRFVLPNLSLLEAGDPAQVLRTQVVPYLDQQIAPVFEEVARQHLVALQLRGELPARYDRIGGWWRRSEEVDLAALSREGALLLGECKWSRNNVGIDVLRALQQKTAAVQADLKRPAETVTYALWSRSGFTAGLRRKVAGDPGVLLFDLGDL